MILRSILIHLNIETYWAELDKYYPNIDNTNDFIEFTTEKEQTFTLQTMSWIIRVLQDEQAHITDIHIAWCLCIIVPNFWENSHKINLTFSERHKKLTVRRINNYIVKLSVLDSASFVEKETISNLHNAFCNQSWQVIAEQYHYQLNEIYECISIFSRNIGIDSHSYLFLIWHYLDDAMTILNQEEDYQLILVWLTYIPTKLLPEFAMKTSNLIAKFLILLKIHNVSIEHQQQFVSIWNSLDFQHLKEWLTVFNHYPVRYPYLQIGLGRFLADTSVENISIYIDSLPLENDRETVLQCLQTFFESASTSKKKVFCEMAFKKWDAWDFQLSAKDQRKSSSLDLAIIMYFKEFFIDECNDFIQHHLDKIQSIHHKWFENETTFNSYIQFHLAKIQPPCWANYLLEHNLPLSIIQNLEFTPDFFKEDIRWQHWYWYYN